ncbi:MAG: DUF3501 family protein [Alphaproteobacteria bacterium]|nr:DUF3501 family protein [Alphaproteobacteria bacterium]
MIATRREIGRDDLIMDPDAYRDVRAERRKEVWALKANRRIAVGPFATFMFENFDTMRHQVQEMIYIERGGDEQLEGELAAYNPLIPNGSELVATVMFEIEDPVRRARELERLTNVEETITMELDGEVIAAVPETDLERTKEDGKTSSIHFLHFPFTAQQVAKFKAPGARVVLAINHENYAHMAVLPETVRAALAEDFDPD